MRTTRTEVAMEQSHTGAYREEPPERKSIRTFLDLLLLTTHPSLNSPAIRHEHLLTGVRRYWPYLTYQQVESVLTQQGQIAIAGVWVRSCYHIICLKSGRAELCHSAIHDTDNNDEDLYASEAVRYADRTWSNHLMGHEHLYGLLVTEPAHANPRVLGIALLNCPYNPAMSRKDLIAATAGVYEAGTVHYHELHAACRHNHALYAAPTPLDSPHLNQLTHFYPNA